MELYLMQHGAAQAADVDPQRPLTDEGRRTVARVASHAASCAVRIDRVIHSGKLRAEQSAVILADSVGGADVVAVAGLAPNDPVDEAASAHLDVDSASRVAIVGHLPFVDRLASLLVAGDAGAGVVAFANGGLVRLVSTGRPARSTAGHGDAVGAFSVSWVLSPAIVLPAR